MRVWAWLSLAAAGASGALGAAACSSTTTTTGVVPLTGITIHAADLTNGLGCGTGAGQVYKYAAIVDDPPVGAVYDCYADAAFVNLNAPADGGDLYSVQVFLYDQAAYAANAAEINAASGASNAAEVLAQIPSTWTTACSATQTGNLQTVALCSPLQVGGPGSMQIATNSFSLADGGAIACNTDFDTVIGAAFDGGLLLDAGSIPTTSCPNALTLGPYPPFAQASATVTLLAGVVPVGSTTCRASITPNVATPATCDPLNLP